MPLDVRVDAEAGVVHYTATGTLRVEEILHGLERMVSDPAFEPGMPQLFDLTGADEADLRSGELRRVVDAADRLGSKLGASRLALVADDPVLFGISRMYEGLTDALRIEVRVFRDPDAARAWLRGDARPDGPA